MPRQPHIPFEDSVYRPVEHKISRRGVAPDLPQDELGDSFLASALNFLTRDGRVRKRDGYLQDTVTSPTGGVSSVLIPSSANGIFSWVSPSNGATKIIGGVGTPGIVAHLPALTASFSVVGSISHTPGLSNATFFTSMRTASSGFRIIHTNGVNPPAWWNGATSTTFVTLSTSLVGATAIAWKSHLLLGDTTVATGDGALNVRIHWSALGSPAIFFATASAGTLDLTDANGSGIQRFEPLRTTLAVYKEEAVHALIYKASPLYFTQSVLHPTLSTLGRRVICSIENGERHFVMTKEGAIIWDGHSIRQIGANRVDRTLLNSIDPTYRQRCWAAWHPYQREVLLGVVTSGATTPNRVWIYNLDYDSWWETDLDFNAALWMSYFYSTPRLVATRVDDTELWFPFQGASADGSGSSPISCSLQTGLYDYDAFENKGLLQLAASISPGTGSSVTVSISKAAQANPLATPTFTSAQSLTSTGGVGLQKIDFRRSERWLAYRLEEGASSNRLTVDRLIPGVTERTNSRINR